MAGMPQKMLEHLLETRLDARHLSARDEDIIRPYSSATDMFLDDFLLTHIMFMPTHQLITELMRKYPFCTYQYKTSSIDYITYTYSIANILKYTVVYIHLVLFVVYYMYILKSSCICT